MKNHDDVLSAFQYEIERRSFAPLRCRFGFHKISSWWVSCYAYVQVRRCTLCGCALMARDGVRSRTAAEPGGRFHELADDLHKGHYPPAPHRPPPPPHMNRGKATTGPG